MAIWVAMALVTVALMAISGPLPPGPLALYAAWQEAVEIGEHLSCGFFHRTSRPCGALRRSRLLAPFLS
jgi:hypothetical protein